MVWVVVCGMGGCLWYGWWLWYGWLFVVWVVVCSMGGCLWYVSGLTDFCILRIYLAVKILTHTYLLFDKVLVLLDTVSLLFLLSEVYRT